MAQMVGNIGNLGNIRSLAMRLSPKFIKLTNNSQFSILNSQFSFGELAKISYLW